MASQTFLPTGAPETWLVPAGVTEVTLDMAGGAGGSMSGPRAGGGRVQCLLEVTPGDTLYIYVAEEAAPPSDPGSPVAAFFRGGLNFNATGYSIGGGGLSAVVDGDVIATGTILAVAGGGGGRSGPPSYSAGGAGGGLVGQAGASAGSVTGGGGGTQVAGGAAGTGGGGTGYVAPTAGEVGGRHQGGNRGFRSGSTPQAGSGGAGWYGGGGGDLETGGSDPRGGGGGGSSYTHPSLASAVTHTQGYQIGDGYVTLTWTPRQRRYFGTLGRG